MKINPDVYSVYVLRSINQQKIYVGMATNIFDRLKEHNRGKSKYTKAFMPWEIIYSELIGNSELARKREKYLKSAAGKNFLRKLKLI